MLQLRLVERTRFDFAALLQGGDALSRETTVEALAPHLAQPVAIDRESMQILADVGATEWTPIPGDPARVERLLTAGLLIAENDDSPHAVHDRRLRDLHWQEDAALVQAFTRWSHNDSVAAQREARTQTVEDMVVACGPPPPHFHRRDDALARIALGPPTRSGFDDLLERRTTCRNYDRARPLALADLATMLKRVFGAQGMEELAPGVVALKKNHPSGGGLHPIEAYLIVQRIAGLGPGLYHYNVEAHALDLLRGFDAAAAHAFAMTAVAGQDYFADAPVMVVMTARFARSLWKYRNHPKIYRAIVLEMGHASQNIYLTATELNLGAFVTAAINEVEIEQALALDPMAEGPLAICGFGARGARMGTVEFDPAHRVWSPTS